MRFEMARGMWAGLLGLFGATKRNSFVEVEGTAVEASFGPLFRQRYGLEEIASVSLWRREVPWYLTSVGWRTNLSSAIALISSPRNIVKLTLKASRPTSLVLLPVDLKELYVSLEEPDRFLAAMKASGVSVDPTPPKS